MFENMYPLSKVEIIQIRNLGLLKDDIRTEINIKVTLT